MRQAVGMGGGPEAEGRLEKKPGAGQLPLTDHLPLISLARISLEDEAKAKKDRVSMGQRGSAWLNERDLARAPAAPQAGWPPAFQEKQGPAVLTAPCSWGLPTPGPRRLLERHPLLTFPETTWAACWPAWRQSCLYWFLKAEGGE